MAAKHAPRCTHIKINGRRCGSPALRGEFFCYFHAQLIKGVRARVDSRLDLEAMFESPEHIQYTLMEIYDQVLSGKLDLRRANVLLRALHIAVINSRRVQFSVPASQIVRELPDYNRQYLAEHPEHCSPEQQAELQLLRQQFHLKVKVGPTPAPTTSDPKPQQPPSPPSPRAVKITRTSCSRSGRESDHAIPCRRRRCIEVPRWQRGQHLDLAAPVPRVTLDFLYGESALLDEMPDALRHLGWLLRGQRVVQRFPPADAVDRHVAERALVLVA